MPEPVARLIEVRDGRPGRAHELGLGAHVIGRDGDADLTLDHADVSRAHAELTITADGATLRDLGSKNGVVVDGRKCARAVLDDGAQLSFGELQLRLEHPGARVDRLLARSGEATVRRPRAQVDAPAEASRSGPTRAPSLLLPALAALAFASMLLYLLVSG